MLNESVSTPPQNFTLRSPNWRWVVAVAALSAAVLSVSVSVDGEALRDGVAEIRNTPLLVVAAFAAYGAAFWLKAAAWRALFLQPPPLRQLVSNLHAGLLLNHLLPVKAGEVARPALAIRHGATPPDAIASSVVARALDFVCLSVLAIALVPAAWTRGTLGFAIWAGAASTLAGVIGLVAVRARTSGPLRWRRAEGLASALRSVPLRSLAVGLPAVAVSWVLEAVMVYVAADLLGHEVGLRAAVGATAVTVLFQAVHITPGGIGIYEAAMTAALVSFGVPAEAALSIAILTHGLKFAYAFGIGGAFGVGELVFLLRSRRETHAARASRLEIVAARAWNVLNEGKPFTPVFSAGVLAVLAATGLWRPDGFAGLTVGLVAVVPLLALFWRFDFPLKLRSALWVYLAVFCAITGSLPWIAAGVALAMYLGFTVVLWGTVYYHLRIGTGWGNGFRFARLVFENPDPTSGNLLEQLPKVLMLVFAFTLVAGDPGAATVSTSWAFAAFVALTGLLLHRWFFTWVPALPQRAIAAEPPAALARRSRRVIAIVIDGCRADRLIEANTPFIDRLRMEGADFRAMSTVYPARTVTCFSSMLTGAAPEVHGMRSNFVPSLGVKCESVFDSLRASGLTGRLVGIAHLVDAFGHDVRPVTAVMDNDDIDDALIAEGKRVLRQEDPELLVLQLLSVDQTGHARGSYKSEYLAKIEETDRKIEQFLDWCTREGFLEEATVMVTADHGQGIGIGGHGHMTPPEITIPCVVWGEGVAPGSGDAELRFITDFAPTICSLLGARRPQASVGRDLLASEPPKEERPVVFVVPAFNEEANLPKVLSAINEAGIEGARIIVVDDGSTDGTADAARGLGALVVHHQDNRGLGAALRTGLEVARGLRPRAVVYLDADGEYDAREASLLLAPIFAGDADYVLGSRLKAGRPAGMTRSRYLANRAFSMLIAFLALRRISDGQTGFRAFSARAADVAEIVHDYNYAQVLTLDLVHKGMRMKETPVTYRRRNAGRSFVSSEYLWRVPVGMMREMLRG